MSLYSSVKEEVLGRPYDANFPRNGCVNISKAKLHNSVIHLRPQN
jgi:hypothetical protein